MCEAFGGRGREDPESDGAMRVKVRDQRASLEEWSLAVRALCLKQKPDFQYGDFRTSWWRGLWRLGLTPSEAIKASKEDSVR